MADTQRGERPLSPHLSIYRFELNMITSIMHRITGVGLAATAALLSWWLLAASTSDSFFGFADWLITSWVGNIAMALSVVAFWYHFCNGARHLIWDVGCGFDRAAEERMGWVVIGATVLMSFVTFIVV